MRAMADGAGWDRIEGRAGGAQGKLFNLVLGTSLLTVATLGVYSFWYRTRVRRWLWSSVRIGGTPFEYTGRPLEKLTGFVFAAVLIAVWLGIVTMLAVWLSLNLFTDPTPGALAAFSLILPVYFWAQYRGLRYLLGHTIWRGIAFRMEPGAWGYMALSLIWLVLVIVSLGLLEPVRRRSLWRYRTRRARWGDTAFRLEASLGALYRVFLPLFAVVAIALVASVGIGAEASRGGRPSGWILMLVLCLPALAILWVRWKVRSFAILASGIRLEAGPALSAAPRTARVIGIHILGAIVTGLILGTALPILLAILGVTAFAGFDPGIEPDIEALPLGLLIGGGFLIYGLYLVLRNGFGLVFTTYPLIRHVAETLVVDDASQLSRVRRGEGDWMADADGFANLFDTGAGI